MYVNRNHFCQPSICKFSYFKSNFLEFSFLSFRAAFQLCCIFLKPPWLKFTTGKTKNIFVGYYIIFFVVQNIKIIQECVSVHREKLNKNLNDNRNVNKQNPLNLLFITFLKESLSGDEMLCSFSTKSILLLK